MTLRAYRLICLAALAVALTLPLAACQQQELAYAESYHAYYDNLSPDGFIKIESEPAGAEVFLVEGMGKYSSIGVTPMTYQVEASGRPYAFVIYMEGHFERRIDCRPMPDNTDVRLRVRLHKDYASPMVEEPDLVPTSPYRTLPEERNFGYFHGLHHSGTPSGDPMARESIKPNN
ncbi:MAG: hypothetical protein AB7K09_20355 [Planctomycetota bacterium]